MWLFPNLSFKHEQRFGARKKIPLSLTLIPTCALPAFTSSRGFNSERLMYHLHCCRDLVWRSLLIHPHQIPVKYPETMVYQVKKSRMPQTTNEKLPPFYRLFLHSFQQSHLGSFCLLHKLVYMISSTSLVELSCYSNTRLTRFLWRSATAGIQRDAYKCKHLWRW